MRLLDLFCGVGGAAMGYSRAGFTDIVGVDIAPQPRYPFTFVQGDALEYVRVHWHKFDVIHASPPCQRYSQYSRNIGTAKRHPDALPHVRRALYSLRRPFVLENVPGSPMSPRLVLCGSLFGLPIVRHRWFEIEPWSLALVMQCAHVATPIGVYGNGTPQWHRQKLGRNTTVDDWRSAMGIDWMTRDELAEAIPPAYTEFIGRQLLRALE